MNVFILECRNGIRNFFHCYRFEINVTDLQSSVYEAL